MTEPSSPADQELIRAAGGIVRGTGDRSGKIIIVHRSRYNGEIGLPKGKLKDGETVDIAAAREVEEETGQKAVIREYAGTTRYTVKSVPKTVTYFLMDADGVNLSGPVDTKEIAAIEWVTPREALRRLTHRDDRDLIESVFGLRAAAPQSQTFYWWAREITEWIFGAPERDRLMAAIADAQIEIDRQRSANPYATWTEAAGKHLDNAKAYSADWNVQQGWASLMAAERVMLASGGPDRIMRMATILRREADKISGWRAKAIDDLIGESRNDHKQKKKEAKDQSEDSDDNALPDVSADFRSRVVEAAALRDDQANTTYFKILMRRRHLFQLFLVLWPGIAAFLWLVHSGRLPEPFNPENFSLVAAVVVFGALGAAVSVGQGLLPADVSAKIPAQQIGAFVVWMRPGIGAVAALVAMAIVYVNKSLHVLVWQETKLEVILVIAFAAGFSERFIVGAIDRIAKIEGK